MCMKSTFHLMWKITLVKRQNHYWNYEVFATVMQLVISCELHLAFFIMCMHNVNFDTHCWVCYRILVYFRFLTSQGRYSNALQNGRHLCKKTKYLYILLADVYSTSVSRLLYCFSQKWYVIYCFWWYLLLMLNVVE